MKRRTDERGAVAVMSAVLAVVLLVLAAFVVDIGRSYVEKRELQTGADAASLVAAQYYMTNMTGTCTEAKRLQFLAGAEAEADAFMTENIGNAKVSGVNLTVTCGAGGKGVTALYSADGDTAQTFGTLATGGTTITTNGRSAATYTLGTDPGICALCFLGSLDIANADYSVIGGGGIAVQGTAKTGATGHFRACESTTTCNSPSTIVVNGVATGNYTPAATKGTATDPLAGMTMPFVRPTGAAKSDPCGTGATHGPGVYGALDLPNSTCTLQPGAYYVTGLWAGKNNTKLVGTGVTLYFTYPNGELDLKNGTAELTAPTTAPYAGWPAGMSIVYDRNNSKPLSLQGNGSTNITFGGAVYAVASTINFNGNSCFKIDNGPVVANSGTGNGTKGCVTVNGTNAGSAGAPPTRLRLTQ